MNLLRRLTQQHHAWGMAAPLLFGFGLLNKIFEECGIRTGSLLPYASRGSLPIPKGKGGGQSRLLIIKPIF